MANPPVTAPLDTDALAEHIVHEVTDLAAAHADLVIAVRNLLEHSATVPGGSTCRMAHMCEDQFTELERLTAGSP